MISKAPGGASSRNSAVDLVKAAAICGVLLIHVSAGGLTGTEAGSVQWVSCLFWNALSRSAVPLFLMASGALLLPPEHPLTLKKLYTRNFPRLLIALLVWAAGYKLFLLAIQGGWSPETLVQAGKELILFHHEGHLYYLHIMLLVYAFLPVTRLAAEREDRRLLEYLLGLWFLLGILYPTVRDFWPVSLLSGIPVQWRMNMAYAAIGYTLLGYYLAAYRPISRRELWAGLLALGFGITFGGTWAASMADGTLNDRFLEGMGLGPFLAAAGFFGLCLRAEPSGWKAKCLAYFSKASFCVFLSHIFFIKTFAHFGVTALRGPAALMIPLLALVVLGCSCAVYALLSCLPLAQRWLV